MPILEDKSLCHLASRLIDAIGAEDVNVVVQMYGRHAEGGWRVDAFHQDDVQQWGVEADALYDAAVELAALAGFDLEDG